ncbi:MAG: LLM class flavin-dependent oxidoreductase, partial [Proteobacteria bacterium]|nr:LLM class flavin-dependent oxidoreductase [Pseudomonadota bacterium]
EAHDLIIKAHTTHDGPFNFEGKYFQYRNVNVWPRPYQAPHPPVWITSGSADSARQIAEKGYVLATLNTGYTRTPALFEAYRKRASEVGQSTKPDRLAYLALVGVGHTKEEGFRRAHQVADYSRTTPRAVLEHFYPPGYNPLSVSASALKASGQGPSGSIITVQSRNGRKIDAMKATVEDFIDAGLVFAGTPDMVFDQIKEFHDHVGGFGHLLMMAQGGHINHEDTTENLKLFSKEVLPRLSELTR